MSRKDRNRAQAFAKGWNDDRSTADRKAYRALNRQYTAAIHSPGVNYAEVSASWRAFFDDLYKHGNKAATFPGFADWQLSRTVSP